MLENMDLMPKPSKFDTDLRQIRILNKILISDFMTHLALSLQDSGEVAITSNLLQMILSITNNFQEKK